MQEKYKHEDITHVQNALWKMYKDFLEDHSVKNYTNRAAELVREHSGNKDMKSFAENLIISWTPVINGLAADFRAESGDDVCK